MMTNKWVQLALLLGITVGLMVGGIASLIEPYSTLVIAFVFGGWAIFKCRSAQGTDGWSGPYRGK